MRFLSEKIEAFAEKMQSRGVLLAAGVSLFAVLSAPAQTSKAAELTRRENEQIIKNAQKEFDRLYKIYESDYSRQLDSLESHLNNELRLRDPSGKRKVVVLNTAKVYLARSLGFDHQDALDLALDPDEDIPGPVYNTMYKMILLRSESTYQTLGYVQTPCFRHKHFSNRGTGVLIPAAEHELRDEFRVPGFSAAQSRDFTNRHESWHALAFDFAYRPSPKDSLQAVQDLGSHEWMQNLNTPHRHNRAAQIHQGECFADVAALGDMIRAGAPVSIIGKVADWRRSATGGHIHMTAIVLKPFEDKINEMGVEAFRALPKADAEKIYARIVKDHAMQPQDFAAYQKLLDTRGKKLPDYVRKAEKNPAMKKALFFSSQFNDFADKPSDSLAQVAREKKIAAITKEAAAWDALKALKDEAVMTGGALTPENMVRAYRKIENDLNRKIAAEPDNDLYREQAVKLQYVFINEVKKINYTESYPKPEDSGKTEPPATSKQKMNLYRK